MRSALAASIFCLAMIESSAAGATYFVDPVSGDNARDGLSRERAWKTIPHAEQNATKGSTVYLMSGNYGSVSINRTDNSGRAGWEDAVTLTAQPGDSPILSGLLFDGDVHRYVIFDKLLVDCLEGNGATIPVIIQSGEYIKIQNCEIRGVLGRDELGRYNSSKSTATLVEMGHPYTSSGIGNIFITGCNIHTGGANGMSIKGPYSGDLWIQSNEIHNFGASGIGASGATNGYRSYFQNNKIYSQESVWVGTEYYHGSGLSIRVADVTATGNILRACGASTTITCYRDVFPDSGYQNMVFENNLVYDALNSAFAVRLEDIGSNFVFNNNTIFGPHSGSSKGVYYYRNVLYITRFATGCERATVQFCNNLFAGYTSGLDGVGIKCVGNIIHAYGSAGPVWRDQNWMNANLPGNLVYCWSTLADNGEFRTSGRIFKGGTLFDQYATTYPNGAPHRVDLGDSFALAQGSQAIGYAGAAYAPTHDIRGVLRDSSPDAGCYEYTAGGTGNNGPVFAPIGNRDATAGTRLTFQVTASDPNGDALTYSASGLPQGATFSGQTFDWTPAADQTGSRQITFTVSDGQAQDSVTITITVVAAPIPNSPPVLGAIGGKSVNENELLTFPVSATDADAQDTLSYSATGLPSGAGFSGQTFSWRPDYSQAGSYQLTFTVSDGRGQSSETVTISVANVNRAPALNSVSDRSVDSGNPLQFSISATDADGDSLTYSATGLPAGANLTGQSFTWTPTSGQVGSYEITFAASDGSLSDSKTATLVVVAAQLDTTPPVVARTTPGPDSIQAPLNSLVTLHVTDAGTGVDAATAVIRVNDQVVYQGKEAVYTSPYGRCSRSGSKSDYRYIYQPDQMFEFDQTVVVKVNATDLQGNAMSEYSYSYLTEMRSFGANKQVSKGTGSAGTSKPVTVRDTAGNLWAAWHAGPQGARDIYVAKMAAGNELFQSPVRLTTDGQDQCNPDLAAGPDGKVYVAWQDNRRGKWDIFASICSDHQNFSRETRVSDSNDNEINPAIVVDGQSPNRVYIAWQDGRNGNQDIYVATSANAFVSTTISRKTTNATDQTEPDMTVGGQNTVYLVWTDMRNGQADIYGAASNAGPWTNVPIVTSAGSQTDPAVAAEPAGSSLHLLWVDNAHGDQDIYYAFLAGLPASPVAGCSIVDDTSGADQVSPTVACGENGRAFACWQDSRHDGGADTDLYFAELRSGTAGTNILVGDNNTNTGQSEPAIGVNTYGHPYVIWSDDRDQQTQVYYAAATFINPQPLDSELVAASAGATIGTDPLAASKVDDVSIVLPPGACQTDMRVTISRVVNPQIQALDCLGSYDFGPSGIDFDQPVTVTIPYRFSGGKRHALPYWYDSLTGALSQQGITQVESVVLSSNLNALRFKTTHFTAFYLVASDSASGDTTTSVLRGTGAGGCSMSATGKGSPKDLLIPYAAIAAIMIILRRRDRRRQRLMESAKE